MTSDDKTLAPIPHPIEFDFFSKQSNKTTKLVNSADGFKLDGANRWYDFEFTQPVYLTKISIEVSGYDRWHKFEVEVDHIDGTKHQQQLPVDGENVSLKLGKLATGFRFRPDRVWITQTDILRVVATGYTLDEFHEYEAIVKNIRSRTKTIDDKEVAYKSLEESEKNLQASVKALTSEVGKLTAQRSEISESATTMSNQIKERDASKKDIETEIESLQEERRGIRAQITSDTTELDNLTKKIRLFPSEVAGFVGEGTRNIRNYLLLSLPFTAILCVILWSLFSSSIDLTQLWRKDLDVDVWTIFLTRIPFVLVAITLVETCGFIVGRLVFEIVKINRQRLEFSKLSIVAKDVVTSASTDTTMTEAARFAEETKLKMTLLQEHMKSQSQEEFKYSGTAISAAIIGVATRLSGGKS